MLPGMLVNAFNPSSRGQRPVGVSKLEASLLYTVSSRTARDHIIDPVKTKA